MSSVEPFHFRQFSVAQDRCAMKVGTDGVLLGALASLPGFPSTPGYTDASILDIGTGTGLIALMMAQRLKDAGFCSFSIDAVEIDHDAATQAAENFTASPWSGNIRLHECPLNEFRAQHTYDVIVCNPPFYNATLKPEDKARAVARHKDSLPLSQIMKFATSTLSTSGRLALIYPTDYDQEVMTEAAKVGLSAIRIVSILTKEGKPCKRRMTEFSANGGTPEVTMLPLRNYDSNYSDEYRKLTNDFYVSLR